LEVGYHDDGTLKNKKYKKKGKRIEKLSHGIANKKI